MGIPTDHQGEEFQNLAPHPTAPALATHILGAEHILSSLDAHITHPGNKTIRSMPISGGYSGRSGNSARPSGGHDSDRPVR